MKIHIHYDVTDQPWGGGNSFLRAFRSWIDQQPDLELVDIPSSKVDIFLINGASRNQSEYLSVNDLNKYRKSWFSRHRPKFVYRLDGFRSVYAKVESPMDVIQRKLVEFSDHVIFQSQDCLKSAESYCASLPPYSVIHNAVDQDVFYPNPDGRNIGKTIKVMAASWSPNPRKGHALVAALSKLPDVQCTFYGNWPDELDSKTVDVRKPINRELMAQAYRSHDIFFHGALTDPCPNVICEALASGLPVICLDSGGSPELVGESGYVLPVKPSVDDLRFAVDYVFKNDVFLQKRIINSLPEYSIETVGFRYIDVFKNVVAKKVD